MTTARQTMDPVDRRLLTELQARFPLVPRPFKALAGVLGISEKETLERTGRLKAEGIIRQISAIFDSASIGYRSTLVAFRAPAKRLEAIAAAVSSHVGVSHNYQRRARYNLWFTLTLPERKDLRAEAAGMARDNGITEWLFLPALKTYKIRFNLDLTGGGAAAAAVHEKAAAPMRISKTSRKPPAPFIRALQKDLPLTGRPFRRAARELRTTEKKVIERVKLYRASGAVRRLAAVLRQAKAGYTANVMAAWAPPPSRKEALAAFAAAQPGISHCYERPSSPAWPYSIYTMVHGRSMAECGEIIRRCARESGVRRRRLLPTVREYKKVRVEYYPQAESVTPRGGAKAGDFRE